jgi:hypothetical protein
LTNINSNSERALFHVCNIFIAINNKFVHARATMGKKVKLPLFSRPANVKMDAHAEIRFVFSSANSEFISVYTTAPACYDTIMPSEFVPKREN